VLDVLTLIVPTLGREKYVDRQLKILGDCSVKVVLVDGGVKGRDSYWIEQLPRNFRYFSLPGHSYAERMRFASQQIDTPFAAILADDDIFLPSALNEIIANLNQNPTASSAIGRTYRFHVADGEVRTSQRYDFDRHFVERGEGNVDLSAITQDLTSQYNYYAVFRRDSFLENLDVAFGVDYSCPYVSEVAIRLLGVMRGNGLVLDVLWWLRSDETEPVSVQGWERSVSFKEWFENPQTEVERDTFLNSLSRIGIQLNLWTTANGRESISQVVEEYIRITSLPTTSGPALGYSLLLRIGALFPRPIRLLIKRFIPAKRARQMGLGLSADFAKFQLHSKSIRFDEMELDSIFRVIIDSSFLKGS